MTKDNKLRALEHLAFRYWTRNKRRSAKSNWKKAEKLLAYIEKRKSLIERIINE